MFTAYESVFAPSSSHGARAGAPLSIAAVERDDADAARARAGEVRGAGGA